MPDKHDMFQLFAKYLREIEATKPYSGISIFIKQQSVKNNQLPPFVSANSKFLKI